MTSTYNIDISGDFFAFFPSPADPYQDLNNVAFHGSFVINTTNNLITEFYSGPNKTGTSLTIDNGQLHFYVPSSGQFDVYFTYVAGIGFNAFNAGTTTTTFIELNDDGSALASILGYGPLDTDMLVQVDAGYPLNPPNPFTITLVSSTPAADPVSNICFPANTPITLDQGIVAIDLINPAIHTIRNKRIVAITKTTSAQNYLVRIEKDALGTNLPSEATIISPEHKILYKNTLVAAKQFLGYFEKINKAEYNNEPLYNVLLDDYSKMNVNNLTVETLDPTSDIAQIYNGNARINKKSYIMGKNMNSVIRNEVSSNSLRTFETILPRMIK